MKAKHDRPGARISHYVVTRGGLPCVLLISDAICPRGAMFVAEGDQQPTKFPVNRDEGRRSTTYAKRRAFSYLNRTVRFIKDCSGTLVDTQPFVKRLLSQAGDWEVIAVKLDGTIKCALPPSPSP